MTGLIVAVAVGMLLHEAAHAYVGHWLGDPTPVAAGRVTLNPVAHLSLVGSVLVPFCCYMVFGSVVAWGRAVPLERAWYTRGGWLLVLGVGPWMNVLVAGVCWLAGNNAAATANLFIAAFNMLPIAPLDGGRILLEFLE